MRMDVWSQYELYGSTDRSSLTAVQRAAFAVCDLRQEVNSGGFDSYFRYWGSNTAPEALEALPEVLGKPWADLLLDAMEVLGPVYPGDPGARSDVIDERDLSDRFGELDSRFYDLEDAGDADARLNAYLSEGGD